MVPIRMLSWLVLLCASLTALDEKKPSPPRETKHCGVSWVAGRQVTEAEMAPLSQAHVNWIVQTPFGWQRRYNSPQVALITSGRVLWGERDEGLEVTTRLAREAGIRTLLKPHIWLTDSSGGKWRTHIEMESEEDWQKWFISYREFILHYARFAEKNGIEALCIGTELHQTAVQRDSDWRKLIQEIRKVYHGQLTYAANWWREFEEVKFWDELDYIGIQAYFPLSQKKNPTLAELKQAWIPHRQAIEKVQQKYKKPVVFTEVGYKSTPGSAIEPWKWPNLPGAEREVDLEVQVRCYQAFFHTFWNQDWFAGAYIWKWFPRHRKAGGNGHFGFTPQNKPALKILSDWYRRDKPAPSSKKF